MVATMQEILDYSIRAVFTTDWFGTSILALILSASLSALAWMLSSSFQSNELKGWARKELSEFIVTALILVLSVPFLMIITSLSIAYAGSDPYNLAKSFLDKVESDLVYTYGYLSGLNIVYTAASTFEVDLSKILSQILTLTGTLIGSLGGIFGSVVVGGGAFGISQLASAIAGFKLGISLGAPFTFISGITSNLIEGITPILLAFFIQKELLFFIQYTMLPVFFPAGVLLRAFPLTRKAGSTLIAISLTLFIIYPLTLSFAYKIYEDAAYIVKTKQLDYQPNIINIPFFRLLPDAGKYYLNTSDRFLWEVYSPINYSIWGSVSCNKIGNAYVSLKRPPEPPPQGYVYWKIEEKVIKEVPVERGQTVKIEEDNSKCYKFLRRGEINSTGVIEYYISDKDFENNKENSIVLVTSQITKEESRFVIEEINFYLGDPCKETIWSFLWCSLGGSVGESPINDISYLNLAASATIGGLTGAGKAISQITGYTITNFLETPSAAGMAFYGLTDVLPIILLPYVFSIFVFVIIIFITISSFRSISTTIGGETKIIEIGRLI